MRLYLEGKVTEVIEALDEAKLREMSQAALERKAQAEKQIAEVTRSWLLKGKLLRTQFRFPEAEKAYGEAVQLAPGDFEACFEQARFQQMLNRREASLETQTRCMRLAEISNKPRDVAASLRSIGDINTERDSIQEARTALDRALIIGRGLAASGTKDDQALMADVLGSLGSLELKDNRLQQALQAYKKAHDLYSQLAVGNPERYSDGVGSTLNNIGLVMRRENRVEEALEAYEKALAVERRVAQADNDRFRPEIAHP